MYRTDLMSELMSLMAGPPVPEPGPQTLLQLLVEAVSFPLSRIMDDLHDDELGWSPVPDARTIGWVPTGHDPRTDPFTTIGWRWAHFCEELHALASSHIFLGPEDPPWPHVVPEIIDAESAVDNLTAAVRRVGRALALTTDARLDEKVDNEFGRHSRRHWAALMLMEAIHHAAEIGVLRDLYRRRS